MNNSIILSGLILSYLFICRTIPNIVQRSRWNYQLKTNTASEALRFDICFFQISLTTNSKGWILKD